MGGSHLTFYGGSAPIPPFLFLEALPPTPQLLFSWMKKVTKKITAYKKLAKISL